MSWMQCNEIQKKLDWSTAGVRGKKNSVPNIQFFEHVDYFKNSTNSKHSRYRILTIVFAYK